MNKRKKSEYNRFSTVYFNQLIESVCWNQVAFADVSDSRHNRIINSNTPEKKIRSMKPRTKLSAGKKTSRPWLKKLAWSLPLFFLIKGLLWLTLPVLYTIYYLRWSKNLDWPTWDQPSFIILSLYYAVCMLSARLLCNTPSTLSR